MPENNAPPAVEPLMVPVFPSFRSLEEAKVAYARGEIDASWFERQADYFVAAERDEEDRLAGR